MDNTEWVQLYLESEYHGGGFPILYKSPLPSQSKLIELLLKSNHLDQILGLATLIKHSEFDDFDNLNEFRPELIVKLEDIVRSNDFKTSKFQKKRLSIIIYNTELNYPHNKRETLGKTFNEVNNDYLLYQDISIRANHILDSL